MTEQLDGRYPAPQSCPRCGGEMWRDYPNSCVSSCDRCANDPAVVMEWVRENRRDDA